MALTAEEQELFDIGKGSLPYWYADDARANEFLIACAKIMALSQEIGGHWLRNMTLILEATGSDGLEPDWLNQHAIDRGTSRQNGEDDETLRTRLRNIDDAVTPPSLLAEVVAMMDAAGVVGDPAIVELPRDRAHNGEYESDTGEGECEIVGPDADDVMRFTADPDFPFAAPPFDRVAPVVSYKLVINGTTSNDGTFDIIGLDGNAVMYVNAAGADETTPPTMDWTVEHYDSDGNLRDGWRRAYSGRGYRSAKIPPSVYIVILPFGTDASFAVAVREMLRKKKAAGIRVIVERREIA